MSLPRDVCSQNNYTDIASIMHCALLDSDLIVSDVTAGLILLRRFQRLRQKLLVSQVVQFSFVLFCILSVVLLTVWT